MYWIQTLFWTIWFGLDCEFTTDFLPSLLFENTQVSWVPSIVPWFCSGSFDVSHVTKLLIFDLSECERPNAWCHCHKGKVGLIELCWVRWYEFCIRTYSLISTLFTSSIWRTMPNWIQVFMVSSLLCQISFRLALKPSIVPFLPYIPLNSVKIISVVCPVLASFKPDTNEMWPSWSTNADRDVNARDSGRLPPPDGERTLSIGTDREDVMRSEVSVESLTGWNRERMALSIGTDKEDTMWRCGEARVRSLSERSRIEKGPCLLEPTGRMW